MTTYGSDYVSDKPLLRVRLDDCGVCHSKRDKDEKGSEDMKNLTIIVLSIAVIVSSFLMRKQYDRADKAEQAAIQNEKTAVHFSVLSTKSALLTTAWSQYHLKEISFDSLKIVQDRYRFQLKEINEYWESIN